MGKTRREIWEETKRKIGIRYRLKDFTDNEGRHWDGGTIIGRLRSHRVGQDQSQGNEVILVKVIDPAEGEISVWTTRQNLTQQVPNGWSGPSGFHRPGGHGIGIGTRLIDFTDIEGRHWDGGTITGRVLSSRPGQDSSQRKEVIKVKVIDPAAGEIFVWTTRQNLTQQVPAEGWDGPS